MEPVDNEEDIPFDENVTVSNTEEINPQFAFDKEGIDHEMQNDGMESKCVSGMRFLQCKIH